MYKAFISDKSFEINTENDQIIVDSNPLEWDVVKIQEGYYHIIHQNRSYKARVLKVDHEKKLLLLRINNQTITVTLKDKMELLLEKMGIQHTTSKKINHLAAPMPGLILEINVSEGDPIKKGDPLLVLEAMKMENVLKSEGEGVVKSLKVKKGDSVEKNQVLIQF